MELRHLRYFVALAEELHFGRAAARLHISQPPLSQQVRALEEELQCQLFDRNNRSVAITEAGLLFLDEAREILRRAEKAKQAAARAHLGQLGEINLSMFPSGPLIPEIVAFLKFFRQSSPGVHLALRERASNDVIADLEEGKADAAFVRFASVPMLPEGFVAQRVVTEPFVAVMSKDHHLADSSAPLDLAELSAEPFIHFPARHQYAMSMHFHQLCRDAGFHPIMVHEANDNSMIVALVGAGFGMTLLPRSISRLYEQETHVRGLRDERAISTVWFVHAAKSRQPIIRNLVAQYTLYAQKQ